MAFARCSFFLLCGMSGLLSGVWSFPILWKNIKCPADWTQLDCHCYIFVADELSFVDAEEDCIMKGGNLVSIHNDLENKIVKQLIDDDNGGATLGWIGLHDTIANNDFFWTDGSIVDFTNFDNLEPSGGRQCVEIQADDGLWQDDDCTGTNPYVCIMDVCHGGDPSSPDCP